MFRSNKKPAAYDREKQIPVVRASICTGEREAGFKDKQSGKFTGEKLIRNPADLKSFLRAYGVKESELRREW
ncbi:MAG: aspartate dehydrogenase [Provencibacterium sp.]|nr:aspartate dehydrogenase [Provencibacterium sp.]